jgi:hypothetical protein
LPYEPSFEQENANIDDIKKQNSTRAQHIFSVCMEHHQQEVPCADLEREVAIYFDLLHKIAKKE